MRDSVRTVTVACRVVLLALNVMVLGGVHACIMQNVTWSRGDDTRQRICKVLGCDFLVSHGMRTTAWICAYGPADV